MLLTTLEVVPPRYRRRNPPLATVPCRQLVRWLPSDFVAYCWVPARDRHSLPSQRPIFVLRLRSQPQPFVCCRWRSFPLVSEPSLPSFCRHDFVIFATVAFRWPTTATMRGGLNQNTQKHDFIQQVYYNDKMNPIYNGLNTLIEWIPSMIKWIPSIVCNKSRWNESSLL